MILLILWSIFNTNLVFKTSYFISWIHKMYFYKLCSLFNINIMLLAFYPVVDLCLKKPPKIGIHYSILHSYKSKDIWVSECIHWKKDITMYFSD